MLLACLKKTVVLVSLPRQLTYFAISAYLLCKDSLLAFTTDFLDCPFLLFKILFRIPGICSYR